MWTYVKLVVLYAMLGGFFGQVLQDLFDTEGLGTYLMWSGVSAIAIFLAVRAVLNGKPSRDTTDGWGSGI